MLDWDGYRYFLSLHRKGTLKDAAEELGVDQTTVGRRVAALEESLGTRLFEKRSDGFFLTLAGERIRPAIEGTESSFLSVERIIAGREEKPEGIVRLAMPGALANHWLIPRLEAFHRRYPRIELEFLTGPEVINLARRDADLAVRLVRPSQHELVARRIGALELALFGHPALWKGGKKPARKEQLDELPFIGLYPEATSELESSLLNKLEPHLRYRMRSAAWSSVFYALQARLGIGILPRFVAEREPALAEIAVAPAAAAPLWLVVHPEIAHSARVRAVIEFMGTLFG